MGTKEKYFQFLDGMPNASMTAGMGACQKLKSAFPELTQQQASEIVVHWLETLPMRHFNSDQ